MSSSATHIPTIPEKMGIPVNPSFAPLPAPPVPAKPNEYPHIDPEVEKPLVIDNQS